MGDAAPATSAEVKVKAVLDALTTLPAFDYNAYESGIQNLLGVDSNSWSNVCSRDLYGETPTLGDVSNVVQRFKVQTIALGVSRNSQFGFADTVIMVCHASSRSLSRAVAHDEPRRTVSKTV